MFQLKTSEITESLKSQIATLNVSKNKRGMHIKRCLLRLQSKESICLLRYFAEN